MKIAFILVPGYSLMSLASAVEPLRAANHLAGKTLYHTFFYSRAGGFVASTAGGGFDTVKLSEVHGAALDIAFVVAGGNPMRYDDPALANDLRAMLFAGAQLGGISGGAAILAKAGLMVGRRFTVHWAHIESLLAYDETFLIERALYVIDRDRSSCAGGVAAMDMMGALIARQHGVALAHEVSDWFIHPRLRTADEPQQARLGQRLNVHNPTLAATVELMASHLADPLSPLQLAGLAGMSLRQLHRLFAQQFGASMMTFYRDLRLAKANELLRQSGLPLLEIAVMTGFSSAAHFARCFAEKYGLPPSRKRQKDTGIR